MLNSDILHRDFKPEPYWWEAYRPRADELVGLPREVRVAIIGAGYAGLSTALELAKHGIDAVVLEAAELGSGASTEMAGRSAAASISARVSPVRALPSTESGLHACCRMPATPSL
jgi:NADPH-dependent 2,4-dienoyl-CoA reductase/sulfur reductase-like enzyme